MTLTALTSSPLPTPEEEVWRYSRIDELDLAGFHLAAPPGEKGVPEQAAETIDAVGRRSALLVVRNGHVVHSEVDAAAAERGLYAGPLAQAPDPGVLGTVAGDPIDVFGHLSAAHATGPLLVRAPAGLEVDDPVLVVDVTDADEAAVFPRLFVDAGEGSGVTVLHHQVSTDVHALVVPVVELAAGPASRLRYVNAQQLGYRAWQIGRLVSRVDRDAQLQTANVALGGDYARLRIDSTMMGPGGNGEMLAVYFGEGSQMHDFRTLQDHVAPRTTSDLLFKGAVQGTSRSVYTGLIRIEKRASGVNAFQTNRNIKLSPGAWAESVPNLEIENNDVRCSHASTVGPIDETQRFYLESRGVPPVVAERLVVLGFFDEVLTRLPSPGLARLLRAEVGRKLERRES